MKKKILVLFITTLTLTAFCLTGCSKKADTTSTEDTQTTEQDNTTEPADTSSDTDADTDETAGDLADAPEVTTSPEEAAVAGEGANLNVAGESITPATNTIKTTVGSTFTISSNSGSYELTIDKIELTDDRNGLDNNADHVIAVTYTYKNISVDPILLIDDLSFRLADDQGNACLPYYLSAEETQGQPVDAGDSCTAVIAFEVADQKEDVTLYYNDYALGTDQEYTIAN